MKKLLFCAILTLFFAQCGRKFSLQKRHYTKGFYFASGHSKKMTQLVKENYSFKTTKTQKEAINEELVSYNATSSSIALQPKNAITKEITLTSEIKSIAPINSSSIISENSKQYFSKKISTPNNFKFVNKKTTKAPIIPNDIKAIAYIVVLVTATIYWLFKDFSIGKFLGKLALVVLVPVLIIAVIIGLNLLVAILLGI